MKKVLVTSDLPGNYLTWLADRCEVTVYTGPDEVIPRDELLLRIADCDGLLSLVTNTIDKAVVDAAPKLRVVSNYAVGYNNIDVEYCTLKGVRVCNTPGVLTETTADCAFALLLSTARKIVAADKYVRSGAFQGWKPDLFMGYDVFGKTIGIVGMGRIGQAVARRATGFNMNVIYFDSFKNDDIAGANRVDFKELLKRSDFISLHVPYTEDTHHLIDAEAMQLMKPNAILINTARGPVVDEAALALCLKNGTIAGAGLDVFEHEPQVHSGLLNQSKAVLLPHIGSSSVATRHKMAEMAVNNLWNVLNGAEPWHAVNELREDIR